MKTEVKDDEGTVIAVIHQRKDGNVEITIGAGAWQVTTVSPRAALEIAAALTRELPV